MTETKVGYFEDNDPLLAQLAQRLESNPQFMASLLATHRRQEGLNQDAQQQLLGVAQLGYLRLSLCRRPNSDPGSFRAQVEQIARFSGANVAALVQIIRRVDAVESMNPRAVTSGDQQAPTAQRRLNPGASFLAARDHILEETAAYERDAAMPAQPEAPSTPTLSPDRKESSDDTASNPPAQTPDNPADPMA